MNDWINIVYAVGGALTAVATVIAAYFGFLRDRMKIGSQEDKIRSNQQLQFQENLMKRLSDVESDLKAQAKEHLECIKKNAQFEAHILELEKRIAELEDIIQRSEDANRNDG